MEYYLVQTLSAILFTVPMFICLTLSIMFIISISTNDSSMISVTTKDFYIYSVLFLI